MIRTEMNAVVERILAVAVPYEYTTSWTRHMNNVQSEWRTLAVADAWAREVLAAAPLFDHAPRFGELRNMIGRHLSTGTSLIEVALGADPAALKFDFWPADVTLTEQRAVLAATAAETRALVASRRVACMTYGISYRATTAPTWDAVMRGLDAPLTPPIGAAKALLPYASSKACALTLASVAEVKSPYGLRTALRHCVMSFGTPVTLTVSLTGEEDVETCVAALHSLWTAALSCGAREVGSRIYFAKGCASVIVTGAVARLERSASETCTLVDVERRVLGAFRAQSQGPSTWACLDEAAYESACARVAAGAPLYGVGKSTADVLFGVHA